LHFKFISLKDLKILFIAGLLFTITVACNKPDDSKNLSPTVHIEQTETGYMLIRNGEPFYIKGGGGNGYLEELKIAGGNTIRVYDTINLKQTLDKADALGLAVVVDIPLPQQENDFNGQDFNIVKKKIKNLVFQHKDHPALLYWNLGNELLFPNFYKNTDFFTNFNSLIDVLKETDLNHPVSTALIGGNRRTLVSLAIKSPDLDLISMNSFGSLSILQERLKTTSLIWKGPYVISEWGINGPWEEDETTWGAPIEDTSTKKAEIIRERHSAKAMKDNSCLGSIYFFWGNKQEGTPTWFSTFSEDGSKSQAYHELRRLWSHDTTKYRGPKINYALLNNEGAFESLILSPVDTANVEILFHTTNLNSLEFNWELRKEAWFDILEKQPKINMTIIDQSHNKLTFITPENEGPYRIFFYAKDSLNNFATANIPFYVLKPNNGE